MPFQVTMSNNLITTFYYGAQEKSMQSQRHVTPKGQAEELIYAGRLANAGGDLS